MFNWLKNKSKDVDWRQDNPNADESRFDRVTAYYEGEVDTSDLWDPDNVEESICIALIPHGYGKISYKFDGEVLEKYEGNFHKGEYSGEGKLVRLGKEFIGKFEHHKFVE